MAPIRLTRRRAGILMSIALAAAVAGCASPGPAGSSGPPTSIVVYSPQGGGKRGAYIADAARKELGVDVTFVTGGGGELASRLVAEANNPQADVVLGLGDAPIAQVAAAGVLVPYTPAWAGQIPPRFTENTTGFTRFSQTPIVIAYDARQLPAPAAPKSWEDLARPEFKNKFVFPSVSSQTGQAAAAGILWRYADRVTGEVSPRGWEVLTAVIRNAVPTPQGQTFDWRRVAGGELPLVVSYLGDVQTGGADNGVPMTLVDTAGGTPFVTASVGLTRTAKAQTAQRFIDWFGSPAFQVGFIRATSSDTPLNTQALAALPDAAAAVARVSPQDINWSVVSGRIGGWMQRIQLEIVR